MHAAVLRYRVMAYITGVVLMVLCFVGIPLQIAGHPAVANDVGVVHGILYIIYIIVAYALARRLRLTIGPTVLLLLAGTIPVLTFVVERWMTRRYINPAIGAAEPAAQVQQVAIGRGRRGLLQQQPGAGVEAAGGEHPGVGLQLQVNVGQHHPDLAGPVRGRRLGLEVVGRHSRQDLTGACVAGWPPASAASAGAM